MTRAVSLFIQTTKELELLSFEFEIESLIKCTIIAML